MNNLYSPLRYPGGKGSLSSFLADIILYNNLEGGAYYEPYAGGAGAALYLLINGFVNEIHLNDADYSIYAFWHSILHRNQDFIEKIVEAELNTKEWQKQKKILKGSTKHSLLDVGFAVFYMNRCNRSGIINNAGPIGGYAQEGRWKIDARFNKTTLCQRIKRINKYKNKISIYNIDAIDFLKKKLPRGEKRRKVFVYLDPPYFNNGKKLYLNYYEEKDHKALAKYIKRQSKLAWILTYDNAQGIKKLYRDVYEFSLNYSLQEKKKGKELLVAPQHVCLPQYMQVNGNNILLHN